jgi:hypothetical protein
MERRASRPSTPTGAASPPDPLNYCQPKPAHADKESAFGDLEEKQIQVTEIFAKSQRPSAIS